jgi:hypothetical protein
VPTFFNTDVAVTIVVCIAVENRDSRSTSNLVLLWHLVKWASHGVLMLAWRVFTAIVKIVKVWCGCTIVVVVVAVVVMLHGRVRGSSSVADVGVYIRGNAPSQTGVAFW